MARLILVTPYDSIQEIAAAQFPIFPVRWLLRDKFESWRYAPKVNAPTTILVTENDEVIPVENSKLLASRFALNLLTFIVVLKAGHHSISQSQAYQKALVGH